MNKTRHKIANIMTKGRYKTNLKPNDMLTFWSKEASNVNICGKITFELNMANKNMAQIKHNG